MPTITWRTTKPGADLDYRCDAPDCAAPADHIHFIIGPGWKCKAVLFSCPEHDCGGYPVPIEDWFKDEHAWISHFEDKGNGNGTEAIDLLYMRIDQLRRVSDEEVGS